MMNCIICNEIILNHHPKRKYCKFCKKMVQAKHEKTSKEKSKNKTHSNIL